MSTIIWGPTLYGYITIITTLVLYPIILRSVFSSNTSETLHSWTFISLCALFIAAFWMTALDTDTQALFY